ncbi:MAG: hypothetical protein ACR2NZ_08550 [Rubripirellula sp.]
MTCRRPSYATFFSWTCLVAASVALPFDCRSESPLPSALQSVNLGDVQVTLPEPTFSDSLDASAEQAALKTAAGKYPLDRFTRESIVSPFTLSRESIKDSNGVRIGHRVDLWFVAHGSLSAIRDEDLFGTMLETDEDEPGSGTEITEEELASRGLKLENELFEEAYYRFAAPILDQVRVRGVVHGLSQSTERSHFASVTIADCFDDDEDYPNLWEHIKDDTPSPLAYTGFAGYAKATQLQTVADAVLVECHAVLHEPVAWFKSPNLLSSKLPLVTQDTVRSFRRALAKRSPKQ